MQGSVLRCLMRLPMDGIAVEAKKTRGASEEHPLVLRRGEDFQVVDTGDPIREPYDAVIMAEDLLEIDEDTVQIMAAVAPWNHIRPIGEDIVAGEMLLPGHHRIRPVDIGVLLGGGILQVRVHASPSVRDHSHRYRDDPAGTGTGRRSDHRF